MRAKKSRDFNEMQQFIVASGSQDACATVYFSSKFGKLRADVKLDSSYKDQCRASISLWIPTGWTLVADLPSQCVCGAGEHGNVSEQRSQLWATIEVLLALASDILKDGR